MDIMNLGSTLSIVRDHLPLFAFLLLALPPFSVITIKFWLAHQSASKTQAPTEWFVSRDQDSDGMRCLFDQESGKSDFNSYSAHQLAQMRRAKQLKGVKASRMA
jgi:hypothetical protein